MQRHEPGRAMRLGIALLIAAAACGHDTDQTTLRAGDSATAATGAGATPNPSATPPDLPAELTADVVAAYERGIAREIELVRAAKERASTATTPQARGEAMQDLWEDRTAPEGAKSAGLDAERYRQVRRTVHDVLRTLDFQGKIDGPMQMDTSRATPEVRQQLASDAFGALTPASRSALEARMDRLVPLWVQYVTLTAVGG